MKDVKIVAPRGDRTMLDVVENTLSRLEERNPAINAFTTVTAERARAQAQVLDKARGEGPALPLAGLTFAAKNLFDVQGEATAAGSVINLDLGPATQDSEAVRLMSEAGAILVGMTNMDEYAYGFTTENTHYGAVRNPHDYSRTAGGSSGGSAAVVAAGIVPLALGTDTNGSIRVPAACCGIFGLKPTFGRVSLNGAFPFIDRLDHAGPFAANSADLTAASLVLLGMTDEAAAIEALRVQLARSDRADGGLRVGILNGYFDRYMDDEVRSAFTSFTNALGTTTPVTLPYAEEIRAAAFLLTAREGGERHESALLQRYNDFDPNSRDRLTAGLLVQEEWLDQARRILDWARNQTESLFAECDIIIAPSTPCAAPLLGQDSMMLDGQEVPTRGSLGLFTQPLTPMGMPIVGAPLADSGDLPVGIQIIAPHNGEAMLLAFVSHLEDRGLLKAFGAEASV